MIKNMLKPWWAKLILAIIMVVFLPISLILGLVYLVYLLIENGVEEKP